MRSTRFWALALGAAALCCAAAILVLRLTATPAAWAVVYQDGEVVERIDLSRVTEGYSFTVEGQWGSNTVEVEPGRIRVSAADCPDQVCVRQGWVSDSASPIVCLPHRLVIQLTGGESGVDAVS